LRNPAGADENADGPPALSAAPHVAQNLKRGGLSLPHPGQMLGKSDPQLPQNLVWDGLSYSQLGQSILARSFRQGTPLPNINHDWLGIPHPRLGIPGSRRGAHTGAASAPVDDPLEFCSTEVEACEHW
jgi:hypothetical protein